MGKITSLLAKIQLLKNHLAVLKKFESYSQLEIVSDDILKSAFERELYLIADLVIQICEIINAYQNIGEGFAYRESMQKTLKFLKFQDDLFDEFLSLAGFRNRLAHEYAQIDYDILYDIYKNKITQVYYFLELIETKLHQDPIQKDLFQ